MVQHLNGWQRLWFVVTALWEMPVIIFFALWVSEGSLRVYTPPQMVAWEMGCSLDEMVSAVRTKFPVYRDLPDAELKTKIAAKYFSDAKAEVKIDFFLPEGVDGTAVGNLSCADAEIVVNPDTKQEQLAVLATLDSSSTYPTWHKGHDLASALDAVTQEEIDESRRDRRDGLLLTAGAAVIPPIVLYALGAAVAWIRRGFRPQPPPASPSVS